MVTEPTIAREWKKEYREGAEADVETEENEEQEGLVPLVTVVNKTLHSIVSLVEVYINNQPIHNSNGLYAQKFRISNDFKGAISEHKEDLRCEGYDYEVFTDELMEAPPSEPFFAKRMKMLSRPDGFMLYGKLGVDFFSTSELPYPNMKIWSRMIRAGPKFYMISENPNVRFRIVHSPPFTRRIALTDDYQKERKDMLPYTLVELNHIENLAETFIIPARKNQFIHENNFNKAPARQIAIAMNTNSAFRGSYTENSFQFQHFDLRQFIILRSRQPIVVFHAGDNCHFYVTPMKASNF